MYKIFMTVLFTQVMGYGTLFMGVGAGKTYCVCCFTIGKSLALFTKQRRGWDSKAELFNLSISASDEDTFNV